MSFLVPQTERFVIGITGRIGAGKTSAAKHLSTAHQFQYVRYSQVLSEWRIESQESKASLQQIGWEVMSGGLQDELNSRLIERIQPSSHAVVDGLRHPTDHARLTKSFAKNFHLIYIDASIEARWHRLRLKYETFDQFLTADSHPVEQQIESLRSLAARVISNDREMTELYGAIEASIAGLLQRG